MSTVNLVKHEANGTITVLEKGLTRQNAITCLLGLARLGNDLEHYDLISTETGRYVSWVLPGHRAIHTDRGDTA